MPRPAVRTERLGPIARITLARPEVRNAQNTQLILELDRAMRAARRDDAVRVVVLAAAGPSFSAGHDLKPVVGEAREDAWRKLRATPEGRFKHHFMVHQFMHGTKTAMDVLAERRRLGSMRELIAARDRGVARRGAR